jgi:hypothetical protein
VLSSLLASVGGCGAPAEETDGAPLTNIDEALHGKSAAAKSGNPKQGPKVAELEDIYQRWSFGRQQVQTDSNGNAVFENVVLVPLPSAPGDGTPGSLELTLSADQAFFLPLFGLFGASYTDGTPPDPFEPISIFKSLDIEFTVDGVLIVKTKNVMDFFSKYEFTPPIPFEFPPYSSVLWGEDVSVFHPPLCAGTHTLKLDVRNTEPAFGSFLEYHNTWNLTVKRPASKRH